jgi:hypothetical protein
MTDLLYLGLGFTLVIALFGLNLFWAIRDKKGGNHHD